MNSDTGEIKKFKNLQEAKEAGFTPIPRRLRKAAEKKIKQAGNNKAFVSLTSGGELSKFAASERKKKRKAQKASRKKNR